jgi:hypothetical protein
MRLNLAGDFIDEPLPGFVCLWDRHVFNSALTTDGVEGRMFCRMLDE